MTIHDEEKRHFTDCSEEEIEIRSWLVLTESDALSTSVDAPTCLLSLSLPLSRHYHSLNMIISASTPTRISSVPELKAFLFSIPPFSTLYLDLEENCLSRHRTISLIAVLIHQ